MYAQNSLPTDSTTGPFPIGFNYLDAATISVTQYDLDGVSNPVAKTFTFAGTVSEDQPSGSTISLDVAIAAGKIIKIAKTIDMDTPALIWNAGAEITQKNLRKTTRNLMEMAQTAWDYASKAYAPIAELVALVASAGASASASAASAVDSASSLASLSNELALTTAQKVLAQDAATAANASKLLADADAASALANKNATDAAIATIDTPTIQRILPQPAPSALNTAQTIATAHITSRIITCAPAAAISLTLPTGTVLEGLDTVVSVDECFNFSVIVTAAFAVTLVIAAGVTSVGSLVVAANTSANFRLRKTATNTFVIYRV